MLSAKDLGIIALDFSLLISGENDGCRVVEKDANRTVGQLIAQAVLVRVVDPLVDKNNGLEEQTGETLDRGQAQIPRATNLVRLGVL